MKNINRCKKETRYNCRQGSRIKHFFTVLFTAVVSIAMLLFSLFAPLKETISCENRKCTIKDYSVLRTYTSFFDLSNAKLKIRHQRSRGFDDIELLPVSKCGYSSVSKAENDKYILERNDNAVLKHACIGGIFSAAVFLFLFLLVCTMASKYCLFLAAAVVIRFLYILLV